MVQPAQIDRIADIIFESHVPQPHIGSDFSKVQYHHFQAMSLRIHVSCHLIGKRSKKMLNSISNYLLKILQIAYLLGFNVRHHFMDFVTVWVVFNE